MKRRARESGFTLLEVLVATVVMGIAVSGLIAGLSQSVRNASRLSEYDRIAMLARTRMNELLLDPSLPYGSTAGGKFDREETGGMEGGWSAVLRPFESPPAPGPGSIVLEEIDCTVWWQPPTGTRRTLRLAGYRRRQVPFPAELEGIR